MVRQVLSGYGDLLLGRKAPTSDPDSKAFMDVLPQYTWKMKAIHEAVRQGSLPELRNLIDRKKLALCRDSKGSHITANTGADPPSILDR